MAFPLAGVLILHVLFVLMLRYEMQPKPKHLAMASVHSDHALIVRLIDHSGLPRAHDLPAPAPAPPPMSAPPRRVSTQRVRPVTHEKSRTGAMIVQDHEAGSVPAASATTSSAHHVFAKDGSVRLPPTTTDLSKPASAKATSDKPADDRQIMKHDSNRMHYKATRFEKYFPPPNETAGGALGRHVGDAIKEIAKSLCDPKRKGAASDMLCGAPPLPPSPKDRDERLNLPPPSLTDDPHSSKPPPLSTCIADYKAGKPLSYGCPVNTPDRAFKAEMRVCIDLYRAGKRLKTWCPRDTPKRAAAESATPANSSSVGSR